MKIKRHLLHVISLLCGCLASAAGFAQAQVVHLENFSERLTRDVPVSGRMLVGVMASTTEIRDTPTLLTPRLLWRSTTKPASDSVCLTMASRDGQYYGEGKLTPATLSRLTGPVAVQGRHTPESEKYLRELDADELAILASIGECRLGTADGKSAIQVVEVSNPSRREGSPPEQFMLLIMLNAMTYVLSVELSVPGVGKREGACRTLSDTQRNKAFNTVCQLNVSNKATEAELVIYRRRYERSFTPLKYTLLWSPL